MSIFSETYGVPETLELPVAHARPIYPSVSSTFVAYNERHNTIGQAEHALKVHALANGVTLDRYNLPVCPKGKAWSDLIEVTLVERFSPENRKGLTEIKSVFEVPVWSRVLLMSAESLLGMDNSMARVSARIVHLTLSELSDARFDMVFHDQADSILAVEYTATKSTRPFVLFTTVDSLLASVVRLNKLSQWLDDNLESNSKVIASKSAPIRRANVKSAW